MSRLSCWPQPTCSWGCCTGEPQARAPCACWRSCAQGGKYGRQHLALICWHCHLGTALNMQHSWQLHCAAGMLCNSFLQGVGVAACGSRPLCLRLSLNCTTHVQVQPEPKPTWHCVPSALRLAWVFTCRRQDRLQEAVQQLQHSLKYFPRFVAAHSALGQVRSGTTAPATFMLACRISGCRGCSTGASPVCAIKP